MPPKPSHTSAPWPMIRNAVVSTISLHRKHTMYGLVEADVTETCRRIAELRRRHRVATSLHIYLLYCLSRALAEHPELNTYRRGSRLITFSDVDIATTAEKRMPGSGIRYAAAFVVRAAQTMSLADLNRHMRHILEGDPTKDETVVMRRRFARLPGFVRWLIGKRISADPFMFKRIYGTAALTNLQLADVTQPYFAIPPSLHTFTVARGGLTARQVVGPDGRIETRKFLPLTMAADHAIVDGIVASRVGRALIRRLQNGEGLDDAFVRQSQALRDAAQ